MDIVARFEIPFYQYLNNDGLLTADAPGDLPSPKEWISHYRTMMLIRLFDEKAIMLQRTGKLGTYPSIRGQEAVFVGIGHALRQDDVFVPYYRDVGVLIQRGVPLRDILLFWGGDERGNLFSDQTNFPYSVPIASQLLHAAGAATAIQIRHEKRAVLATCGDGATSQGDFYEAMNVAGVWSLPIVFVICNNQWAISVPRKSQTASETLAQKAIAAGFSGEQVDGNDIIAVRERVRIALQKAREDHQPTLIEMLCYRQGDHTTADDASRYEPAGLRDAEWKKEPIARLRRYLERNQLWQASDETALQAECSEKVAAEVKAYLDMGPEPLTAMMDYLYAELPKGMAGQRAELADKEAVTHG